MEITPGRKSTEFFALIGMAAMILANGFEAVTIPWEQIQWYGGIVAAYIGGRSWVKGKAGGGDRILQRIETAGGPVVKT